MKQDPSDSASVSTKIEYFAERLNLVFSYFFCTLEFDGDDEFEANPATSDRSWALQTIQNACLHTTLIALRDLDDFFAPRTKRSRADDLKAADVGFSESLSFLSCSERRAIDKTIAHSTLVGVSAQGIRWDVFEMVTKAVRQADAFLHWAEERFSLEQFAALTAALVCRRKTQAIYDYVAKIVDLQRSRRGCMPP